VKNDLQLKASYGSSPPCRMQGSFDRIQGIAENMLHELSMAHDRCVTATHCDTLRHTAPHCITLHHTASHCIALQHTATHCNTLQHTDTGSMRKTYDGDLCTLGRLRLVGSSKLCVCFAEYSLFYRALLQKRPMEICVHKSPSVYMFHM